MNADNAIDAGAPVERKNRLEMIEAADAPNWPSWLPKSRPVFVGVIGFETGMEYSVTFEADVHQPSNATFSHPKDKS